MEESLKMHSNRIYFDCNATTPILKEASQAALCSMQKVYGNPSSTHMAGAEAKIILERSRLFASQVINAKPSEIFFTSGATEAIQTSVLSLLQWISAQKKLKNDNFPNKILVSSAEHKAVSNAINHWSKVLDLNLPLVVLEVDTNGHLNLEEIEEHASETIFLCTMAVNNETGVISDLKKIETIIRKQSHHIYWLVDCVQALGKVELDFQTLSIDYAAFSAHKIHAPKGVGFLYLREGTPSCPLIVGGGQEQGVRSGTENLPGIAAMGVVLEMLCERKKGKEVSQLRSTKELFQFRTMLVDALKIAFPTIVFNTDLENSIPTTINFSIFGLSSKELMNVFDAAGISVSGGSACNSKETSYSHVLVSMKLPEWRCASAIRLSFGFNTLKEEIIQGVQAILSAGKALRNSCLNLACNIENDTYDSIPQPHFVHGLLQLKAEDSNTWLLIDSETKNCVVIDPTEENLNRVLSFIQCRDLVVSAVLDTHSHADHESTRTLLLEKLKIYDLAKDNLGWPTDGDILDFYSNSWQIERIKIPGHTLDSVCYLVYNKKYLDNPIFAFVGDTILCGGLGRTDFRISGTKQFYTSLHLLDKYLNPNTLLCPAHDYNNSFATTWGIEKENNKLLFKVLNSYNMISYDDFCKEKELLDSQLTSFVQQGKIVCGLIDANLLSSKKELPVIFSEDINSERFIIIDIRERAESLLFKEWEIFGLKIKPLNIPMSQITNLMCDLLQNKVKYSGKKIALVCSTGSRSLYIAESFRRIGLKSVWSVSGGMAFSMLKSAEKLQA